MSAVVLGSVNVDLVVRVAALPRAGETLAAQDLTRLPGGKGANQAVALRRLGVVTTLVAAVGDDPDGAWLRAGLEDEGVGTADVVTVPGPSGTAVITLAPDDNTILVVPGANTAAPAAPARWPGTPGWALVLQLEVPLPTVVAAVAAARRAPAPPGWVVLNAAPAEQLAAGRPAGDDGDLLRGVDVLVVNETEASTLTGLDDTGACAAALQRRVRHGVVLTLGARGCLVATGGDPVAVPAQALRPDEVVDTVGAGDTFVAALVAGLLADLPLTTAARHAAVAAALAVTRPGARSAPAYARWREACAAAGVL